MASPNPAECTICHEDFDEESRRPRVLDCSHYFCSECICRLIEHRTKNCPICRYSFKANSVNDLGISYAALDFMRFYSHLDSSRGTSCQRANLSLEKKETGETSDDLLNAIEEAKLKMLEKLKELAFLKESYRKEVVSLEDDIIPKIRDLNVRGNRRLVELEGADHKLEYQLLDLREKENRLKEKKEKLDEVGSSQEAVTLIESVKDTNVSMVESVNKIMEQLQETDEMLNEGRKEIHVIQQMTSKVNESLISAKFADEGDSFLSLQLIANQKMPEQIQARDLYELNPIIRSWVEEGKVYATQENFGVKRSAKISVKGSKLYIHHLVNELPPEEVVAVEYKDLMNLVEDQDIAPEVFMDISAGGSLLGRMQITLTSNTQAAKQFMMLCSGETGHCYARTRLLHIYHADDREYVICGDYEKNNGVGGKALVSGLQPGENYTLPEIEGTLRGLYWERNAESRGAQFGIYTKSKPEKMTSTGFGKVVEGLDFLKEALQSQSDVKRIFIRDCGIVLPCTVYV